MPDQRELQGATEEVAGAWLGGLGGAERSQRTGHALLQADGWAGVYGRDSEGVWDGANVCWGGGVARKLARGLEASGCGPIWGCWRSGSQCGYGRQAFTSVCSHIQVGGCMCATAEIMDGIGLHRIRSRRFSIAFKVFDVRNLLCAVVTN